MYSLDMTSKSGQFKIQRSHPQPYPDAPKGQKPGKRMYDNFAIMSGAVLSDEYFIPEYESSPELQDIRAMFNEERFTVAETKIPYRQINFWDEHGLLANRIRNDNEWHKFSAVEVAWIRIIKHLRDFGMSLDKIAKTKERVMRKDPLHENRYGEFEFYLFAALFSNTDPYVAVLPDGNAGLNSPAEMEFLRPVREPMDMIIIPLRRILKEVGVNVPDIDPQSMIDRKEMTLRQSIYHEGNKEVRVKLKDNKISEIETTKVAQPENPHVRDVHQYVKDSRIFGDVITHMADGKPQSIEIKRRRRFDK